MTVARTRAYLVAFGIMLGNTILGASALQAAESLKVYHPDVLTVLTSKGSDGHQLGDLRVTSVPVADASGANIGRLDATLITTGLDHPAKGDEHRISELVFTLNNGSVLIVGGAGHYPAQGATLSRGTTIERPIKGGAGAYAGARGVAESIRGVNGGWTHEFKLKD